MIETSRIPDLCNHSEKLIHFYRVAESGSLNSVARHHSITVSSLSYSLKILEEVVGHKLFERSRGGMKLTKEGQAAHAFCKNFFSLTHSFVQSLGPLSNKKSRIRLGTFSSIAIYLWPLVLKEDFSDFDFSLSTNRSRSILESLFRRELDIAVTVGSISSRNIVKHPLYSDDYSFFAKASSASDKVFEPSLYALNYMAEASDDEGISLQQKVSQSKEKFSSEFYFDSFEVIAQFISNGFGIGILPYRVGQLYPDIIPVTVKGFTKRFGKHTFYLSYREDLDLPKSLISKILKNSKSAIDKSLSFPVALKGRGPFS